jgi:hypothetical protein
MDLDDSNSFIRVKDWRSHDEKGSHVYQQYLTVLHHGEEVSFAEQYPF